MISRKRGYSILFLYICLTGRGGDGKQYGRTGCYSKKKIMKKFFVLIALAYGLAVSANALTYEDAFDSIKALPGMKGVEQSQVKGHNDVAAIGVYDAQLTVWYGERGPQTEAYGNALYKVIGQLPVSEMIQCSMTDSSIFAIFAKPVSKGSNRIIIFSDSAYAGFTGAMIGYISDDALAALRSAVLIPREGGGTTLYVKALTF